MKHCKNCKANCTGSGGEGYAPNCTKYIEEEKKKMTNADRIRQMTDEELFHVILCPYYRDSAMCIKDIECIDCVIGWLQSKVD